MTLDELEGEIRNLSDADFSRLVRRLGLMAPPDRQWAQVEIDDDAQTPVAIIEYADRSKQSIDIFAWIRKNIMAIGNPIILIAIYQWYEILRHRSALTFKDDWCNQEGWQGETTNAVRRWLYSGRPDKAANNLSRVAKTIIEAAKEKSVSREEALVARVQNEKYDQKDTYLYEAFEWLRNDKTRNPGEKLNKLEDALRKAHVSNHSISIERVMGFLRSEKGAYYIYRRDWDAMLNAFIAWRFGLSQDSVVKYFSKARTRKNEIDNEVNTRFLFPKGNKYQLRETGGWFSRLALFVPDEAYLENDKEDEESEQEIVSE